MKHAAIVWSLVAKRCLCRHAVSVCVSVCSSVTFVNSVETNKDICNFFSSSGSHTILGFCTPNVVAIFWRGPDNGGIKCRWGKLKSRSSTNIYLDLRSVTATTWLVYGTLRPGFCWLRVSDDEAPRAISSHGRLWLCTVHDRPRAVSRYTESQSSVNREYDSKAWQ